MSGAARLAIVLARRVLSVPGVMERIPGGRLQIALGGTGSLAERQAQAEALAASLGGGALPVGLRLVEESTYSR